MMPVLKNKLRAQPGTSKVNIPPFAFIGKFASGKDLYADGLRYFLKLEFGVSVYQVPSFSDRITEMAIEIFDMKEKDRTLLQELGDSMRRIDPKVWAKYLIRKIEREGGMPFVVEGFRDPEELQAFRDRFPDIVVIRINVDDRRRLEAYKRKYGTYPTNEQLVHITEESIAKMHADVSLTNTYDPEDLKRQIESIVKALKDDSLSEFLKQNKEVL